MDWYYANERDEQVQTSEEELRKLFQEGTLAPDTFVWNETMPEWKAGRLVKPEWFAGTASPAATSPAQAAGGSALQPYQPPASSGGGNIDPTPALPRYSTAPPTDGLALASLICGITGLVFMGCYGAGLPISIAAVVCGHLCRKRLVREGNNSSAGLAMAGLVTGYIGIGLIVIGGLILALFIGFAAVASEAASTIQ